MKTETMTTGNYESNETHQLFSRESDLGLEMVFIPRSGDDFIFNDKTVSMEAMMADGFKVQRISDWIGLLTREEIECRKADVQKISANLQPHSLSEIRRARAENAAKNAMHRVSYTPIDI